jgi:membrane protease YdiL (CAAX protease family)
MPRRRAILEPILMYTLILAYIWKLRHVETKLWIPILALMLLSHVFHREIPRRLGFGLRNLRECTHELAPAVAFLAIVMVACGLLLHTTRRIGFDSAFLSLAAYLPWGLLQQYILNGYFFNRLAPLFPRRIAALIAAVLFSGAHVPNPFLMAVTLIGGYFSALVYSRHRNLYILGLAHAAVGFLLYLLVPDSISHHLRVGPLPPRPQ